MATTATPISATISNALAKAFKKNPSLEELWNKVNARIDETQSALGVVDVKQQQQQAVTGDTSASRGLASISPWLIVGAVLLLIWWWRSR